MRLKIDCGFERKPSLFLARHQREIPDLREEFLLRRKMGIELEFYDAPAVRARFPFSRPAALFPRFPHACFALGHGGNGITFSLIAVEIIRDYFLGRTNCDAHLFRFGR